MERTGEADSLVRRNFSGIDPFLPMLFSFFPPFLPVYTNQAKQVQERAPC